MSTTITAKCVDQNLKIVSAPDIASGGVNEDTLVVEFCPLWEGYDKTAVFYRTKDEVYHAPLDEEGKCTIPWEVMQTPGYLYLGVFGCKDDITRTSLVARYAVKPGAITEETRPSEPTPNIYEQILSKFIPKGGSKGQVLRKKSDKDHDMEWGEGGDAAQVQADWSQNDETAVDYVKSRTHYDASFYLDTSHTIDTVDESASLGFRRVSDDPSVLPDDIPGLTIEYGTNKYSDVSGVLWPYYNATVYSGIRNELYNTIIVVVRQENTVISVYVDGTSRRYTFPQTGVYVKYVPGDPGYTHVACYKMNVHPLDERFLPSSVKHMTVVIGENDDGDFVADKPFAEILAFIEAGGKVESTTEWGEIFPLTYFEPTVINFSLVYADSVSTGCVWFEIYSNDSVEFGYDEGGVVPLPEEGDETKFLRGDGTWSDLPFEQRDEILTYSLAKRIVQDPQGIKAVRDFMHFATMDLVTNQNVADGDGAIVYAKGTSSVDVAYPCIVYSTTYHKYGNFEGWIVDANGNHYSCIISNRGVEYTAMPTNYGLPQPGTQTDGKVLMVSDGQPKWRDASCMVFKYDDTSKHFICGGQQYTPMQFANFVPGKMVDTNIVVTSSRRAYILRSVSQESGWTSVFYSVYMDAQDTAPIRYYTISVNTESDEVIFHTELITLPEQIDNAPYLCLLADMGDGLKVYNESGTETLDATAMLSIMSTRPIYLMELQEEGAATYTQHKWGDGLLQFQKVDTTGDSITRTVVTITDTVTKEEVVTEIPNIPTPTETDNGKALVVENGSAVWGEIAGGGIDGKWEKIAYIETTEEVSAVELNQYLDGGDIEETATVMFSVECAPSETNAKKEQVVVYTSMFDSEKDRIITSALLYMNESVYDGNTWTRTEFFSLPHIGRHIKPAKGFSYYGTGKGGCSGVMNPPQWMITAGSETERMFCGTKITTPGVFGIGTNITIWRCS